MNEKKSSVRWESSPTFTCILAVDDKTTGIGIEGDLAWNISHDMKFFRKMTEDSIVIMGRKTYESIGSPLPDRLNIVITKSYTSSQTIALYDEYNDQDNLRILFSVSFEDALDIAKLNSVSTRREIYVIGGSSVYQSAFVHKDCHRIHLTTVHEHEPRSFDVFSPSIPQPRFYLIGRSKRFREIDNVYHYRCYSTNPFEDFTPYLNTWNSLYHQEYEYLNLIRKVLEMKSKRQDRTSIGTFSLFAPQPITYDLTESFPLFTTKRVFWRGVVEELLWMLRGETNSTTLASKNVHIWDGNSTREFLDNRGLTNYPVGELGPVYGYQWRYWGKTDDHEGHDQLENLISEIKKNPTSRRLIISAWNVSDIDKMALPPCHMMVQFYVDVDEKTLSSQMYQRSADLGLGVPFNVASYSLLTHLIANKCGLKAKSFTHVMGDAHIYANHIRGLKKQLKRKPKRFPTLKVIASPDKPLDQITFDDIQMDHYKPHPSINLPFAI